MRVISNLGVALGIAAAIVIGFVIGFLLPELARMREVPGTHMPVSSARRL